MFYFVRHGETDYSEKNSKIYKGFGVNLARLTEKGVHQIEEAAADPRLQGADIILCSPYTRAVQTAAILSKALGAPIAIETDLHEWLADKSYAPVDDEATEQAYREFKAGGGKYPKGEQKMWEDSEAIKKRVVRVLERYAGYDKVVIAGHGVMIQSTTGAAHPENGGIVGFTLSEER